MDIDTYGNEDCDEQLLHTGTENFASFKRTWDSYSDVSEFLARDCYIPVRSCCVSAEEQQIGLDFYPDVDGITIEWKNISGTSHNFHHLYLLPRDSGSIRKVYSMLKKHVDLLKYTDNARQALKECVGTQIFYDSGWEYYLCLLPEPKSAYKCTEKATREATLTWLLQVRCRMRQLLKECILTGKARSTIDKNNTNDVSQLFILPEDSEFILHLFQQSVDEVVAPQTFLKCIFSFRFGEKNKEIVFLPIKDKAAVKRICVHIGVSVQAPDNDCTSLFWSRQGIQSVIGNRGTMTTAFSFAECCNYQSNLDGRYMDVSGDLRRICKHPERIHFVQLYADLPHRYPKTRYHPVSGAILIVNGLRSHSKALEEDAFLYLSEVESNFEKLHKSACRLEYVLSLPEIVDYLNPREFVVASNLEAFLNNHPMLVPFANDKFTEFLREVGYFLCHSLRATMEAYCGTGQSHAVWQAFQYESAVEKLLWGGPLCYLTKQHAVNLGIGLSYPSRSLTDQMGFLCLADKFASSSTEESTPPLSIYSKSECVQKQLKKMFGFSDYLEAATTVLGRRLVYAILQDLYEIGSVLHERFEIFYSGLKRNSNSTSLKISGAVSTQQLTNLIVGQKTWKFPMVSHLLIKLIENKGRDPSDVILRGLVENQVVFFPAIRHTDPNRNHCLYWHRSYGFLAIRDFIVGPSSSLTDKASLMCALVATELEKRHLCYTSKLVVDRQQCPWVEHSLEKLTEKQLSEEDTIIVLCFVTCIAFMQSGRYVDYNQFSRLSSVLPLSQPDLKALEIQGKFLLNKFNKFKVWRLHHSIPLSRLDKSASNKEEERDTSNQSHDSDPLEPPLARIEDPMEMDVSNSVVARSVSHLPSNATGNWQSTELAIIQQVKESSPDIKNCMEFYIKYQEGCRLRGIPDRSYHAFRTKVKRLGSKT